MLIENVCFVESLSKSDARCAGALALGTFLGTKLAFCGGRSAGSHQGALLSRSCRHGLGEIRWKCGINIGNYPRAPSPRNL